MKRLITAVSAILVMLLSACASVPMASMEQDAKAKTFTAPPERAALYIYRNENFGGVVPMTITVNGKVVGRTAAQTYFMFNVLPGTYKVESHAENTSTLSVAAEAGKNYFVWQEVKMGLLMARSLLQQVDDKTGRAGVMESKLIDAAVTGADLAPLGKP
jgi:hypothetical protein